MKSPWQVSRRLKEKNDGERRWDYTFQFLLCWVQEQASLDESMSAPREEEDEDSLICARLKSSPTTPSND